MMSKLNFERIENEFYIWYLGSIILNIFLAKEGVKNLPKERETHKELFFEYLDKIDNIKQFSSFL
nr:hypothetical protein [Malaciobacter halophilus]